MGSAKTIRSGTHGKRELRLVHKDGRFFGMADGQQVVEGDDADLVWQRLHDDAGRGDPRYVGFAGARNRFLGFFPDGFHSARYAEWERDYKVAAKARLDATVPLDEALDGTGFGEAALAVFRATNLLSPFEKTRLQDVLRGPRADAFIRAAARFTLGELKAGLRDMEAALQPHDAAKWTVVTYLPFLWQPEAHMFLKPEVTKDFATRVGHRFAQDYEARLHLPVYESLLDLAAKTEAELASLAPHDRIDVQSFIWAVSHYRDEFMVTPAPNDAS
jgi:hypothetical protein